jgi:hypothetical protein
MMVITFIGCILLGAFGPLPDTLRLAALILLVWELGWFFGQVLHGGHDGGF